jgi:2-phosphosulfolactate phosphatase
VAAGRASVAWGPRGLQEAVAAGSIPVIVDVLRFSSTATTAVANGFTVIPAATRAAAARIAEATRAEVSGPTGTARYSLSPLDYVNPRSPDDVALVSANGAALSAMLPAGAPGFIASFLNARAAGRLLAGISARTGRDVALIAAGEVPEDGDGTGPIRFALEDYLGCGCILSELRLEPSADALVCSRAFEASKADCARLVRECPSGRYLADRGHGADISHCVQRSIYDVLPVIADGRIVAYAEGMLLFPGSA